MKLPANLTLPSARQTTQALTQALAPLPAGGTFCVDASDLADLDTSALAVLLQARRDAQARGLAWQLQSAPPKLRQLAALYGVEALLWPSADPA
ncbi:MAG: STAS domain-containing protein [Betaproteobacteria bacterium]